ncbi:MAG: D-aminopeptidase [Thermomicrobiales bacterium]|nr:D-aminopeptidase [Thermomicrobiales bacterium]
MRTADRLGTSAVRVRARDLGIRIGPFNPGRWNAITDVEGVLVGHTTLVSGNGPLVIGHGPVRTGVTVIVPRAGVATDPLFAGFHRLNGAGEMTGISWVEESGLLTTPIGITNTHSVGVVRDALIAHDVAHWQDARSMPWRLPVVTETSDLWLNDMHGFHVKPEHVDQALAAAASGPVAEGCVGGGTGMNCHEFKGGTGTSSRVLPPEGGGWTVGVLVQANYGWRAHLHVDGVPVGREIPLSEVPSPRGEPQGDGSIVIIVATNAPLLPHQCQRLAQRATIGLARVGGNGDNGSGDLFLAFSTANHGLDPRGVVEAVDVRMLPNDAISDLFAAVADATQEAIVNALCMATTTVGVNGRTSYAIPLDRLQEVMRQYHRLEEESPASASG